MKAPHMPPTEDPGLVASTHKGGGLDRDALALGKQLYEAFWQRQPVGAAAPDFDGHAAAIRDMWSGIAGDALSLISAARKGQGEWRPIESAPRGLKPSPRLLLTDGKLVLVGGRSFVCTGQETAGGFWSTQPDSGWNPAFRFTPTHWMSLPPPPELVE